MLTGLTESAIEDFAIKLFERLGYGYIHAPDDDIRLPKPVNGEMLGQPELCLKIHTNTQT